MTRKHKKAKDWSDRSPEDRVKLYSGMADHCREVAELLRTTGEANEAQAMHLVARQFKNAQARVQSAIDLRTRPQCCRDARLFGDCRCSV